MGPRVNEYVIQCVLNSKSHSNQSPLFFTGDLESKDSSAKVKTNCLYLSVCLCVCERDI